MAVSSPAGEPSRSPGDSLTTRRRPSAGRIALTLEGFLKPEWSDAGLSGAGRLWDQPAPDPDRDPAGYAAAFRARYGLHPAPYPNDGLPMGLRRGIGPRRDQDRPADRLHGLPRRVDRRQELRRPGQHPARSEGLLNELTIADGRRPPPSTFVLNSSRGTNNAGMVAAVLLSFRNPDLSFRTFPLPLAPTSPRWTRPPGGT